MVRGYRTDEIRQKIIDVMSRHDHEMSGVQISTKLGISRITMAKYLVLFESAGLVRKRSIGNVTLWSLEPEQESFHFPDDYFKVANTYADCLVENSEDRVFSLLKNCLDSGAVATKLIFEVILPAINLVQTMYNDGKIGTAERCLFESLISRSLSIFDQTTLAGQADKNVVVMAADLQSNLTSEVASAAYRASGWKVSHLGDMSAAIDVLFDLDFQKLIRRIWRQKNGILIVVVFSSTMEGFNFFTDSVKQIRRKSGKRIKLILCGNIPKGAISSSDLITGKVEDVLQWSQTVHENTTNSI